MPIVTVLAQVASTTTVYAAGDAVGLLFELRGMARTAGTGGEIRSVVLMEDTVQAASDTLFLFDRAITGTAENAAYAPSDVDMRNTVGFISLTSYPATAPTNNQVSTAAGVGLAYQCMAGSTSLWAQLQTNGTPTYAAFGVYLKVTTYYE